MTERIHFTGIGGVGMAGVAFLLHKAGKARVSGCDTHPSARTRWLEAQGIPVTIGHNPAHLDGADRIVVTPAVPPSAPERAEAVRRGIPVTFRGEALAEMFNASDGIAVCGTHGKTTTATFTAKLLEALGEDPSWCIGGECGDRPVAGLGRGPFVVEADESDGTLALYRAKTLVVTNCDFDHPEHFKTRADYRACFDRAAAQAERVIRAEELDAARWPELASLVNGAHNVRNALCAIAVAEARGHARAAIAAALPAALALLPDRRFQTVCEKDGVKIVTDYAHHPAEIARALSMARNEKPKRLRVLFQPHRYSRTARLKDEFPAAFAEADETVLIPVYAAFEEPRPGGDIADLYAAFRAADPAKDVKLARSREEAWEHALRTRRPGDLILLLGAGDIIDLVAHAADDLAVPPEARPVKRLFLGAGTNTWKSDLATGEVYERVDGPAGRPGAELGIPWMAGVPGTVGGWIKMNAGAFGHSISEVVRRVKVDGTWIDAADCGFSYRHSDINGRIEDVEFDLSLLRSEETAEAYRARRAAFPAGTKGSVFKNPPGNAAGRLLEEAGCKGLRVGGAYVWEKHANVIVAGPDATPSDFLALARIAAARVKAQFGITLEPEVRGLVVD